MILAVAIVNANNLPTASGQTISQIESGLIVLALAFVARYVYKMLLEIKDQRIDQQALTNAFVEHVKDDKKNFKVLKSFMREYRSDKEKEGRKVLQ